MRTTITIDDELLAKAQKYTGVKEKSALINRALTGDGATRGGAPPGPVGRQPCRISSPRLGGGLKAS